METNMFEKIKESIQEAEKVIVGIGSDFAVDFKNLSSEDNLSEYQKSVILQNTPELPQDKAYGVLKQLLQGKSYYLVDLNMEDAVYRVFSREDAVVTPCGGLSLLQCSDGCNKDLYLAEKIPGYPFADGDYPVCPVCGSPMVYNNLYAEKYLEEGYLTAWSEYQDFLKTTINKKLCILEFGCSLKFPMIIRFAFDKLAMYNKKSVFYRVHESLWQHARETEDRGISIQENALTFLCKNAEK